MTEIGELLRATRTNAGVSLEEASGDLEIKTLVLENIEDGNIGCFKDIFVLKDYIYNYAKYLGLEPEKIIDEFNEYLFEYTSKIPLEEIEKAVNEQQKEVEEAKVASPYTEPKSKEKNNVVLTIVLILLVLVLLVVSIWAIKNIFYNQSTNNLISYINR